MNLYLRHIGDFNNATRHLTRVERSVYSDAIDLYYDSEQPLPCDDFDALARKLLCRSDEERAALQSILNEFFTISKDGYHNSRCDHEIAKYRENTSAKARAGKASAEKRKQNSTAVEHKSTSVEHMNTNHKPITDNHKPLTKEEKSRATRSTLKTFPLPEFVDRPSWELWMDTRKGKVMTEGQAKANVSKLVGWQERGLDANAALRDSASGGWSGLFEPKPPARASPYESKQQALERRNAEVAANFIKKLESEGEHASV